jgi:pimeloyl-ACP methyl ester carboxylesterase
VWAEAYLSGQPQARLVRLRSARPEPPRLHRDLPHSEFITLPRLGHMIHHLVPDAVATAIDQAAQRSIRMWAL